MGKDQFESYKWSAKTEVLFQGEWSSITEVCFREGKIGIKKTGHLASYWELDGVRG